MTFDYYLLHIEHKDMIQIPVTSDAYRKPINKQLYINH